MNKRNLHHSRYMFFSPGRIQTLKRQRTIVISSNCFQVVATVDENNPLDQVVPPRGDGLNHDLAAYISCKTSKLALPENDKQVCTCVQ